MDFCCWPEHLKFWRGNRVMAIRIVCRLLPVLRVLKSLNVDFQLKKLSLSQKLKFINLLRFKRIKLTAASQGATVLGE